VGYFHEDAVFPAILMISAEDFNKLRNEGKAVLEAEVDYRAGILDPYPKVKQEFPLGMVREIWIDKDTENRLRSLILTLDESLSPRDLELKKALIKRRKEISFNVIEELRHTQLSRTNFYPAAYEGVGAYFISRRLERHIPGFCIRKISSIRKN
jgi:hypothetical protein